MEEHGLLLYEQMEDIRGQLMACHNIGLCHKSMGNYKQAILRFKQARKCDVLHKKSPGWKPLREGLMERLCASLGGCYVKVGQPNKAIQTYKKSLKLAEERKHRGRWAVGKSFENLGLAYIELGQFNKAMDLLQQAHNIAKEKTGHGLPDDLAQMKTMGQMAILHYTLGQFQVAIGQFQLAKEQAVKIGSMSDQGFYCITLGSCHSKVGNHAQAIALQEQGLHISKELKDSPRQGQALSHLASSREGNGEYDLAIQLHSEARKIAKEVGNRAGEAVILGSLGGCYTALRLYSQAIACHREQCSIAQDMSANIDDTGSRYYKSPWADHINLHHEVVTSLLDLGVATWAEARVHNLNDATSNPSNTPVAERLQAVNSQSQQQAYTTDMQCLSAGYLMRALDLANSQGYFLEVEHAHLYLAFLAFDGALEDKALHHLRAYLRTIMDRAHVYCRGCWQIRGEDASMWTCAGCSVAKFCDALHQKRASFRGVRSGSRKIVSHKDICGLLCQFRQVDKGQASVDPCTLNLDMLRFLGTYNLG